MSEAPDFEGLSKRSEWLALLAIIAVGLAVRLVRLGDLSFSGDEETTTLAALALLEGWPPQLPGGTVYLRSLPFTALEAASIAVFGVHEWALRLVPALVAAPRILALWWLARPLGGGALALVCAAALALAPLDLEHSRNARMYSLFATLDLAFVAAIVNAAIARRHLVVSGVLGIAAVLIHQLGVTHAPVAWAAATPGELPARRRLALVACGVIVVGVYALVTPIVMSGYFVPVAGRMGGGVLPEALGSYARGASAALGDPVSAGILVASAALALVFAWRSQRGLKQLEARLAGGAAVLAFVIGSPVLGTLLVAATLLLEGLGLRVGLRRVLPLLLVGAVTSAGWFLAALYVHGLDLVGLESAVRQLLAFPAPNWLYFALAVPVLFAMAGLGVLVAIERGARSGHPAAWLALIAAALAPSLIGGLYQSSEDLRYQFHALGPLLVLGALGADGALRWLGITPRPRLLIVLALSLLAVRADLAPQTVLRGHGPITSPFAILNVAPDHRGAADYLRSRLGPNDWVVAEDALEQRLYLGRTEVWLRRIGDAGHFIREDPSDGSVRDVYTGALHAGSIDEMRALARTHGKRVIWLVTSGECEASESYYRSDELAAQLESWRGLAWFEGEDGMTRVFRLVDGEAVGPE